jgi:ABC-2 type transport system permease protein
MESISLLGRYVGLSIRSQMQYRASFVMAVLGHLAITGVEFLGIVVLFQRFGSLRGWSLPEVALLYGMVNTGFALAEGGARGFDTFANMVKTGSFDRLLLRPRPTALQVAGQEVQLMRSGRFLQGLLVLSWALAHLHVAWTPSRLLLLPASILGTAALFYGLHVLQATMAFWTVESLEMMNALTYGGTETAQYPLDIYRPWFRTFFTVVVPLACTNYFPAQAITGRGAFQLAWAAPVVGVLFLLVSLQAWQVGVRHYQSTGS